MGRDQELSDLQKLLENGDRVAIAAVGMGGVGKTTLAKRYVKQHRADYPGGILWVAVARLVTEVLGLVERSVAKEELPTDWSEAQIVQHYLGRWEARWPGRKLLVLDDVGEYRDVKRFLPNQGAFRVLMTTRVQMQPPVRCLPLGVLEPEAALVLLRELMGDERRFEIEAARALCEWLGYLPLGIELVGRYLAEGTGSIAAVLEQLKRQSLAARPLVEVPGEMDYGRNVQAAIELSWQTLDEAAQQVAMLLGLFALAPVKADWVVASLPERDGEVVRDCLDRELVKRSLLNREELETGSFVYRLHGLVREFLQIKLAEQEGAEELQRAFAQVMVGVAQTIPQDVTVDIRKVVAAAVPHLEEVAARWTGVLEGTDKAWCSTGLARYYQSLSLWSEAERCYLRSLEISKSSLGDRHPDTATSLNNLAGLYDSQGRYVEAEPLYVEALEIWKAELGERHPHTATSLNNLAGLYESQGRYVEAEPLYVEALEIWKAELGERHPNTASSLNNLALLYRSQGRYGEAEPLYVEALEILKAELGDRHPDTAGSLNNLAALYDSQGRYGEAEPLLVEALEIKKAELGDRPPDTAQGLNNLAELYRSQGRYGETEPLYVEALAILEPLLGLQHPNMIQIRENFAICYENWIQNLRFYERHTEALALLEKLVNLRSTWL